MGARTWLYVLFAEKEHAMRLGAVWDQGHGLFYVPPGVDDSQFARWKSPWWNSCPS